MMKKYPAIISILLVIATAWLWPNKGDRFYSKDSHDIQRWQERIELRKPQLIFIGNSMIRDGIDERRFMRRTGINSMKLWTGSSASAWWYLMFKNVVATSTSLPKLVVFVFRDNFLTRPAFRTRGTEFYNKIGGLATKQEPILDRFAYLNQLSSFEYMLYRTMPLYRTRNKTKKQVDEILKKYIAGSIVRKDIVDINSTINRSFEDVRLNSKLLSQLQMKIESDNAATNVDYYDFQKMSQKSFLLPIVDIAKKIDIKVLFLRYKRLNDAKPEYHENRYLSAYVDELKKYIASQGYYFFDYTKDERITLEHFGEGDHLTKIVGKQLFTDILAQDIPPIYFSLN